MILSSNELKQITAHFTYCPRCKERLGEKENNLVICKNCDLHFYVSPAPTTGAVLINKKGEILLVKRSVNPGKNLWDIPGGFVDLNENLEESLNRELKEELGIEPRELKYLASTVDTYMYRDIFQQTLGTIFEGKINDDEKITPQDDVGSYEFFTKENFPIEKIAFKEVEEFLRKYLNIKEFTSGGEDK